MKKGDVVVVHDDIPCATWKMAVIEDLIDHGWRWTRVSCYYTDLDRHSKQTNYKIVPPRT